MLIEGLTGAAPQLQSLRLVMMSGDWIPLDLPSRLRETLPAAELYSLGGATEAAIWSIIHPITTLNPRLHSIPYGRPMANQSWYVLDPELRPCLWSWPRGPGSRRRGPRRAATQPAAARARTRPPPAAGGATGTRRRWS